MHNGVNIQRPSLIQPDDGTDFKLQLLALLNNEVVGKPNTKSTRQHAAQLCEAFVLHHQPQFTANCTFEKHKMTVNFL